MHDGSPRHDLDLTDLELIVASSLGDGGVGALRDRSH